MVWLSNAPRLDENGTATVELADLDAAAEDALVDNVAQWVGDHAYDGAGGVTEGDVYRESGAIAEEGFGAVEWVDKPEIFPRATFFVWRHRCFFANHGNAQGSENLANDLL